MAAAHTGSRVGKRSFRKKKKKRKEIREEEGYKRGKNTEKSEGSAIVLLAAPEGV